MNKRFHLLLLIMGNLLTLGAIFIYAVQSQVQVAFSTYGLVMGVLSTLLIIIFYLWGDAEPHLWVPVTQTIFKQFKVHDYQVKIHGDFCYLR